MEPKQRVSTVSATVLIADDHGAPKPIMAPQVMAALFFPELLGCARPGASEVYATASEAVGQSAFACDQFADRLGTGEEYATVAFSTIEDNLQRARASGTGYFT